MTKALLTVLVCVLSVAGIVSGATSLVLSDDPPLKVGNVESAYRIRRHATTGAVFGCLLGTMIGGFVSYDVAENQPSGWLEFHLEERFGIPNAAGVFQCVLGAEIGRASSTSRPVSLDANPICSSRSKNGSGLRAALAWAF